MVVPQEQVVVGVKIMLVLGARQTCQVWQPCTTCEPQDSLKTDCPVLHN